METTPVEALRSAGIAPDRVNTLFFGRGNIDALQLSVRYRVFRETSAVVDTQSERDLVLIMKDVYLSHDVRPDLDPVPQVTAMNRLVVERAVDIVSSGVRHHEWYLRDSCSAAVPLLPRPALHSMKGSRSLPLMRD